jgi:hypothetical protein
MKANVVIIVLALIVVMGVLAGFRVYPVKTELSKNKNFVETGEMFRRYKNDALKFSLQYPVHYSVDEAYQYQQIVPGRSIAGVKFTISPSATVGTNLSSDSYISVEMIPDVQRCRAGLFLSNARATEEKETIDQGVTYSVSSSMGAGAGNRYEETVYALVGTRPCFAVRYFVHYGAIENYPSGTIQQFNKQALLKEFDSIRRTLVI